LFIKPFLIGLYNAYRISKFDAFIARRRDLPMALKAVILL